MKHLLRVLVLMCIAFSLTTCYKMKMKNKCCDTSLLKQNIVDAETRFFIPNIITPNEDGINDRFVYGSYNTNQSSSQAYPWDYYSVRKLKIYKINGSRAVFESNDYNLDFAGKGSDGKQLAEGRYRYELTLNQNTFSGSLCILRSKSICTEQCIATYREGDPLLQNSACD